MKRILIVEDDDLMLMTYKLWLESVIRPSSNVLVQFCKDGREASFFLRIFKYDITFLDLAIPLISGPELVEGYLPNMGKLVIASSYPEISIKSCKKAASVLTKPFSKEDLSEELDTMLKGDLYVESGSAGKSPEYTVI